MTKTKKTFKITLLIFIAAILAVVVTALMNPMRWSEETIRERLLSEIPVGTKMEDAIKILEENDEWHIRYRSYEHGYRLNEAGHIGTSGDKMVGTAHIRVHIGEYRTIFVTDVLAFLGFDDTGLVDITIKKDTDSL